MTRHTRADLFHFAFTSVEAEYKELSETWKQLDSKAQAATAVSGIFLAATFSFVRSAGAPLPTVPKVLLALAVVALVSSVVLALLCMVVRTVSMAPPSDQAASMVGDILAKPEQELDERYGSLIADTVNAWLPVNRELQSANSRKAAWLAASQAALMIAACLVALLTLASVFL